MDISFPWKALPSRCGGEVCRNLDGMSRWAYRMHVIIWYYMEYQCNTVYTTVYFIWMAYVHDSIVEHTWIMTHCKTSSAFLYMIVQSQKYWEYQHLATPKQLDTWEHMEEKRFMYLFIIVPEFFIRPFSAHSDSHSIASFNGISKK